ncbi:aminotransferase class I/II-fold pyridoxal phosphate-dependent enzyme [Dickeya sp. CFBP 2040]|uniref:aminotransferase class I/II-fold pyridoxal phosphate-dependent enzyme n=1 Tax=Dickeya sp. CFBP 2040 TaxID=2718531 RepID=UPI0014487340|nr:aminotransferase class I/II-fold pyridoxal phosphate-dependent enzyme [Dickeya sp. CFBP 2040]NKI75612.1 aminotransferase class I/II-fold pyridoxal phosphate-dependent enzyme [Dickeya sp. CFBP 2040]
MRQFANIQKMIELSMPSWREARSKGLTNIRTTGFVDNKLCTAEGHKFINMISCSYLGLNRHPDILAGAIAAIQQEGVMSTSASRARVAPQLMDDVEAAMGQVYQSEAILTPSCTSCSAVVLPLIASGIFTEGKRPVMVFDKNCHFSMNVMKAACGDETTVLTAPHNDVEFIEQLCKEHDVVAYIADGAYSMGGNAPVKELVELQKQYGLFLYFDDSHALSVYGERGCGFVRSQLEEMGDRTIIVGSLAKAFGATGGVILFGNPSWREIFDYCGGPLGWSQMINAAGLGAVYASAKIHLSDTLPVLQKQLSQMMNVFDNTIPTANAGNGLPIRIINLENTESAINVAQYIYQQGFYTSAVFFPIVARGKSGLRIMGRADMHEEDIHNFCRVLEQAIHHYG